MSKPEYFDGTNWQMIESSSPLSITLQGDVTGIYNNGIINTTLSLIDIIPKKSCQCATTVNLANLFGVTSYVYNNGVSGVGATISLTMQPNSQIVIDGYLPRQGDRILVKNQEGQGTPIEHNGIYVLVTQPNAPVVILTRAKDYDHVTKISQNDIVDVLFGFVNGFTRFNQTYFAPITVGSSYISFTRINPKDCLIGTNNLSDLSNITDARFNLNVYSLDNPTSNGLTLSVNNSTMVATFGLNSELNTLSNLSTTGLIARTGSGTYATRNLAVGNGLSITNANGVSNNPSISLTTQLQNLNNLNTLGFISLSSAGSGASSFVNRSLEVGPNLSIIHANGVTGNPTLNLTPFLFLNSQTDTGTWMSGTPQITFFRYSDRPEASFGFEVQTGFLKIIAGKASATRGVDFITCDTNPTPTVFRNIMRVRNDGRILLNPNNNFANGVKITGSAEPTLASDLVTKSYADSLISDQLNSLSDLSTTGIMVRTGNNTFATRSINVSNGLSITNANGINGNPTINLNSIDINTGTTGNLLTSRLDGIPNNASFYLNGIGNWVLPNFVPNVIFGAFQTIVFNETTTRNNRLILQRTNNSVRNISLTFGDSFTSQGMHILYSPPNATLPSSYGQNSLVILSSNNYSATQLNQETVLYRFSESEFNCFSRNITTTGTINGSRFFASGTAQQSNELVTKSYADSLISDQLNSLSDLSTTGIITRTGNNTFATRSINVGPRLLITNANGVQGNPTIDLNEFLLITSHTDGQWWRRGVPQITFFQYPDNTSASFGLEVDTGFLKVVCGKTGVTRGVDFVASTGAEKDPLFGEGTFISTFKFSNNGTAFKIGTSTSWTNTSDARIKKVLRNYQKGLKELIQIEPKIFKYTEDSDLPEEFLEDENIGIIAQEIEDFLPECITKTETDKFKDLRLYDSSSLLYVIINSIKELNKEINSLKQR